MLKAIVKNAVLNIGLEANTKLESKGNTIESKLGAGVELDIGKVWEEYKSERNVMINQQKNYFHKHISDILKESLTKVKQEISDFRLIIFIDDLDRCTPERALEILESIKTFFDIEGIIYVIGMDPLTIDPIINTKYGNNPKIDGMHYLQKIVQLPFPIPLWSAQDLSNVIETLAKKAGLSESYSKEILKEENQELIIKATQLNPRDIKRFINSIVLAKDIYKQDIQNIDKIIAIQAFYFHGYKWIEFLKLLIPYEQRIKFLTHFILLLEIKSKDITNLDDLTKIIKEDKYKEKKEEDDYQYKSLIETYQKDKLLNDIYSKLIEIDDNDLFTFLKIASIPLLKIDKIENYLRIVDSTGLTIKRKDVKIIDSQKPLELLQNDQVIELNDYRENENILIHLPYADLQKRQLISLVNLSDSFLFKANLSEADLSGAKLSLANLSEADLSGANLSGANLSWANLLLADLSGANLSEADLLLADLSLANLSEADLSEADLLRAKLSWANLSGANLSGANLLLADLSGANLSGADLTDSIIINNTFSEKTVVESTNFENAIIDDSDFIDHISKFTKNVPEKIKDKKELKMKLKEKGISEEYMNFLLSMSKLP